MTTATVLTLLGLGALHGVNPGMGWLFAVALGIQQGEARAVWRALPPLAVGHALAIAVALAVAALIGGIVPLSLMKWVVVAALVGLGVRRLVRHGHPRYGGMRVGPRQLTMWSFLMASAHGAGLMIVPVLLDDAAAGEHGAHAAHATHVAGAGSSAVGDGLVLATIVHAAGYLLVAGLVAFLVYSRLGVRVLRKAWINLDLIWAGALIATGLVVAIR